MMVRRTWSSRKELVALRDVERRSEDVLGGDEKRARAGRGGSPPPLSQAGF